MIIIYFSGTGNTKYIAERIADKLDIKAYSMEKVDGLEELFEENEEIIFGFPVYFSKAPRIVKEFFAKNPKSYEGKRIGLFTTQALPSLNGVGSAMKNIKDDSQIFYYKTFLMPNNVNNFEIPRLLTEEEAKVIVLSAEKEADEMAKDILKKVNIIFDYSNLPKSPEMVMNPFLHLNEKEMNNVWAEDNCIGCGKCIFICPMDNLDMVEGRPLQKYNCTFCYRCINQCPVMAIRIGNDQMVERQYKGVE